MQGSRWLLLVVALAVIGVVIAKQSTRTRPPSAIEVRAEGAEGTTRPEVEASRDRSASGRVSSNPAAPATSVAGRSAEEKPEGPLPGSKLADSLKSGRPTVADFGMGWCQPCKAMVPVLKQAAQDYWGKANIVFVELQNYGELGRNYRIATMPTQIFFNAKGEEVSRHMGYMGTEDIERELAALGVKK